ncbi:DUF1805 domain-containing protein [Desulfonatronospira sp.]|uniref:YunC family protein n=1 Tax=Desulfonatronospira sp. TaxID=1962951 RepID=UPI0025C62766|nr:DUF1805 domain-containing protein [Desulfonatronospira sp.]
MEGCNQLMIDGKTCWYVEFPTPKTRLLAVRGEKGILGCGYFNMAVAEKIDEALAIVRGVQSVEDMLEAEVKKVSPAAQVLGVHAGMTGREAMQLMA